MLTKNDLILLLSDMENTENIDVGEYMNEVLFSDNISLKALKFINDNRQLDVAAFYEMLRKNYNHKKSTLYKNLVREEFTNPSDVLVTLAALNLQIFLYAKKLPNNLLFLKHSRGEEITKVLNGYYINYDLIPCLKMLKLIKADLKAFEYIR